MEVLSNLGFMTIDVLDDCLLTAPECPTIAQPNSIRTSLIFISCYCIYLVTESRCVSSLHKDSTDLWSVGVRILPSILSVLVQQALPYIVQYFKISV